MKTFYGGVDEFNGVKVKTCLWDHGDINDVNCQFDGFHVISRMSQLMILIYDVDNIHIDNHDIHDEFFDASMDIYGILLITLVITTMSICISIVVIQTFHCLAYPFK